MTPILLLTCEIAGAQHTPPEAQELLLGLPVGWPLSLVPEPENPFDKTAIRLDDVRIKLGYIPALYTKQASKGAFAVVLERRLGRQHIREAVLIGVYQVKETV